jgi:hypothetical protein
MFPQQPFHMMMDQGNFLSHEQLAILLTNLGIKDPSVLLGGDGRSPSAEDSHTLQLIQRLLREESLANQS